MSLYALLLGPDWEHLAPELREFHDQGAMVLEGSLEVSGGGGLVGDLVRRFMGMPTASRVLEGRLAVDVDGSREIWNRSFGRWSWQSAQWHDGGLLVEQFGGWQFRFQLRQQDGQLHLVQRRVDLVLGGITLGLPRLLAPKVVGREQATLDGIEARVEIRAPGGWNVLTYGGRFRKVEG